MLEFEITHCDWFTNSTPLRRIQLFAQRSSGDNKTSNLATLWPVRSLVSIRFIEYIVTRREKKLRFWLLTLNPTYGTPLGMRIFHRCSTAMQLTSCCINSISNKKKVLLEYFELMSIANKLSRPLEIKKKKKI